MAEAVSPFTPQQFPTPSPFSFSGDTSTVRFGSTPSIHRSTLLLRLVALIFSFTSAVALATAHNEKGPSSLGFNDYPELTYCFIVAVSTFVYSALQLFKGVCDIVHRGIIISDMVSDYMSLILDQLVVYLLVSSSSVAIPVIRDMGHAGTLWKATIVSTTMSFVTFVVLAICSFVSGYKLCKRIIW